MDLTPYVKDKAIRRRFLKKVQFCEHGKACDKCCWLWRAGKSKNGYGSFFVCNFRIKGRIRKKELNVNASRFMWTLRYRHTGLYVLHTCDNKACCNYNHLYSGTPKDNMKDRKERNRANMPKGKEHWHAKLTEDKVYRIFYLREKGLTYTTIAQEIDISVSNVSLVLSGKRWKHITTKLIGE